MKQHKFLSKTLAGILCLLMVVSLLPTAAYAAIDNYNYGYQSATHDVFKHTEQTLAPGVTQYTNYAYTTADGKQMVYYVTTADVNRDDVIMQVSYKGMQHDTLGMEKLAQTVKTANEKYSDPQNPEYISEYYNVVSAVNGNGYNMTTGKPSGVWVMGGDIITEYDGNSAYVAIGKDGKAYAGRTVADWNNLKSTVGVQEAINCFGSILVWDGATTITQTSSYYSDRASRTMVGITEDGQIVCAVVDGRQEPFSCGASMLELANIMLEAGCKYAINLDGGGSTTYMAKNEGSNECTVNNRPSDGSERAISNGLIIASLAAPSNVFDHASISVSNNYVMPNASVEVSATGVSPAGTAAEIPESVTYTAELGTVVNGVYTAGSETGTDTIKMMYEGKEVGSCEVNIVAPDKISFAMAAISCPYGKTTDVDVVPTYGEFNLEVAYDANSVSFVLGDSKFGAMNNGKFTATTETLANTNSTITVKTNCTPSVEATVPLQVGRGSEIIWDFEDQDVSKWSYFDYYNSKSSLDISTVDATTGKVHNGNYALALHYDYSQTTYYEDYLSLIVEYNAAAIKEHGASNKDSQGGTIGGLEEDYIDITGACGMGFWLYLPDDMDIRGFNPRLMFGFKKNPTDKWSRGTTSMKLIVDVQHLPTDGWYYYWADLSAYASYAGLTVQNSRPLSENGSSKNGHGGYAGGAYYAGSILDFYVEDSAWKSYKEKSYNGNFTLYIDDWTVDYSTVVEDNQAPEFTEALYACNGMFDAASLVDGTNITANEIDFTISVADANRFLPAGVTAYKTTTNAVGLDASTAKVYVDGVEVAASYKNGKIALDQAINLPDGAHKVTFEMADKNDNVGKKIINFTVNANAGYDTIKVVPHDATMKEVLNGQLYYIDLIATDISKVNKVTTTLKVNNVNNWEPMGIVVADGFTAEYAQEPGDLGELTLTITRTGNVEATGEVVIASVPVRAWYPHNALNKDSAWLIAKSRVFPMDIKVVTKAGAIEFVNETNYVGAFSADMIQIDNEAMCDYGYIGTLKAGGNNPWHSHNAQPVADKPATCTEDGYTGRTFCDVCNSVVDWGTTEAATGHTYTMVDGVRKCACGELFTGEFEGKTYVSGVILAGWVEDSYYVDGVKRTGVQSIDGFYYDFGENGVCEGKMKYTGLVDIDGTNHYAKFGTLTSGWHEIDEEWYYFLPETFAGADGEVKTTDNIRFVFDNGKVTDGVWVDNGKGVRYWYGPSFYTTNSINVPVLLQEIDGVEYIFKKGNGYLQHGYVFYHLSNNPELIWYDCKDDGIARPVYGPKIVECTDCGKYNGFYYVDADGHTNVEGVVKVGNDYYFVTADGTIVRDKTRYVKRSTTGNELVATGYYDFGADGKMIIPEPKNGIVDGKYYIDDVLQANAGLVKVDTDFYYILKDGSIATNYTRYLKRSTTGKEMVATGYYDFGADGKMIIPEPKNGIVDGKYYIDDVLQANAGLVKVGEDFYYILKDGSIATNYTRYLKRSTTGKEMVATGYYDFGADGKMIVE